MSVKEISASKGTSWTYSIWPDDSLATRLDRAASVVRAAGFMEKGDRKLAHRLASRLIAAVRRDLLKEQSK